MAGRRIGMLVTVAALALALASPAAAQYRDEDEGFFLFLDAIYATPTETDDVVVTIQDFSSASVQTSSEVALDWDSEWGGRIEFGYRWPNDSDLAISYWAYENDTRSVGNGPAVGFANFAIGPSIYGYSYTYGAAGIPGHWDMVGKIEAQTIDVMWGREHDLGERFDLGWAVGLRYANFEETLSGIYDAYGSGDYYFGLYTYGADRANKGEMFGLKTSVTGEYSFSEFLTIDSTLGVSLLTGEVSGSSGITPVGPCVTGDFITCPFFGVDIPASSFSKVDDDRSGSIVDFDVRVVGHILDDRYRFWFGYEHSQWRGLPDDLTRPLGTGDFVSLRRRDEVAFNGWKLGVGFLF